MVTVRPIHGIPERGARFVDLAGPKMPPDLPPGMVKLRVVKGGKG
jgi:hypothetical protein